MIKIFQNMKLAMGIFLALGLSCEASLADTLSTARDGRADCLKNKGNQTLTIASNEKPKEMTHEQIVSGLRAANEVAKEMKKFGHHPFGAILVGPDNEKVIMTQGNINVVRHAETELARRAAETYSEDYLANCTLVTTMEPCAMCAGTIYWANIGRVVFGGTEDMLRKLTGDSKMNQTLNVPSKYIFDHGQKPIQLVGPVPEMESELLEPHKGFWK